MSSMSGHTPTLSMWGTQNKTEIGGFAVIGPADKSGPCIGYVLPSEAPRVLRACNAHADLVEALEAAQEALMWHRADNFEIGGKRIEDIVRAALLKAKEQ